ncbi:hypothetical protein Pst134EA_019706 [Puccinia striiformis f. sp. tritici]|uniref:Secreted protein n=1 Tax=Puccinia striiformis f. sp. tritici PST-78 TaxID=1165861 RepID=A0A0L0V772_9BASI|nr:hypothetical protein Pst134EA_019706 [Puccinia striiformis f. sp. tritici]KAH9449821.1 hypothetical protein Pst134EB_020631 [Puccinia striiformis f. sp. tritici]KAH9459561.1 hypothetical protein Pst134EA_019706 [Puccinia striiformis f. sp. tritici]KAI9619008.1 hypothetical protein KEM48_006479 [Puccinia striiformis f. sp. tritici PST-130]KNE95123.1 hypothetical protein PSTG_11600 [Puccinia striiformis f. sp. tritici PST-78]
MLKFLRLIAAVSLIACWGVTSQGGDTYFGCHRNVDAICSSQSGSPPPPPGQQTRSIQYPQRFYSCNIPSDGTMLAGPMKSAALKLSIQYPLRLEYQSAYLLCPS